MARSVIVHWVMAVANGLAECSGTWKQDDWKTWWERHLGKKYMDGSLQMGKGCEDTGVPYKCSPKVDCWGESSNQLDRIAHYVDSLPLSSVIPVHCQWVHEQSVHSGWYEVYEWAQHMSFYSSRLTGLKLLPSARSTNSRDQHWAPNMAPFPRVTNQQPRGRLTTLDHFLCK